MGQLPTWTTSKKKIIVDTFIDLNGARVPLRTTKHRAAKRYILRIHRDGYVQITIPPHGNRKEAFAFVDKNLVWLANQWDQRKKQHVESVKENQSKRTVHYFGKLEPVSIINCDGQSHAHFADQSFPVDLRRMDIKQWLESWLRYKASQELPDRVKFFAQKHGMEFNRVTIRDQRTRWGSCSSNRTISLNWRLIQIPPEHSDYIILHELNHLKHMDHSIRFWRSLEALCPWFRQSEAWLKVNGRYLRD